MIQSPSRSAVILAIIAAALGFFVDAYDLLLYSIVRNQSLAAIGVSGKDVLGVGIDLLNMQLFGMLAGGILFGVLGDTYGRRSVLFGSIILYSGATLANGFVQDVLRYGACRFIAGVGLSGELGAGVTLVSELMSKEHRGYGTMIVAAVGVLGVVTASFIGDLFPWRTAYIIGGGLGFMLLLLRLGVNESGLFTSTKVRCGSRGNFIALFSNTHRFKRYTCLILIAMPIWYAIGILITFSPELAKSMGISGPVSAGTAVLLYYSGLTIGDMTNGLLCQVFKTRKKIIALFMAAMIMSISAYFMAGGRSLGWFYGLCGLIGWTSGYWAVFVTVAAESFGTNLRATVAITAPNFVRGLTALLTMAFKGLAPQFGIIPSAASIGAVTIVIAFFALNQVKETFGEDLDYIEKI
jgi:MFS transporter, putative metabolite:H+ symporter